MLSTSAILPPYLRKAESIEKLVPWLYLKGISTSDFASAKSEVLIPLRYSHGTSFSMLSALRRYGGRIALVESIRCPYSATSSSLALWSQIGRAPCVERG